jgi:hypothetical protein
MQTAAVCTVGDLRDGLGTAEDGGWVRALLRVKGRGSVEERGSGGRVCIGRR